MKYTLSENFRVDFIAHAPMHTFKGWTFKGIDAEMEVDFDALELSGIHATAETCFFDTGNEDRNQAMKAYMSSDRFPKALVETAQSTQFEKLDEEMYKISPLIILEFMGIRKQMPVTFIAVREKNKIKIDVELKWSFKAYGLKAPRLLFLTVRDIVEIKGSGEFHLVKP